MPNPAQVTTEKQRDSFLAALAGDEDWLYSDEGEAAQAPTFRCSAVKRIPSHQTPGSPAPGHGRQKANGALDGKHTRSCAMQTRAAEVCTCDPCSTHRLFCCERLLPCKTKVFPDLLCCSFCDDMLFQPSALLWHAAARTAASVCGRRKRMAALRAVGDPMELRARELSARPRAVLDARAFLAQVRFTQLRRCVLN